MDAKAKVVGLKYSIGGSFLGTVRQNWASGSNELREFGWKGVAIVPMLLLLERRGDDKAMSFFHDLKLSLKRHNDAMMFTAIRMD